MERKIRVLILCTGNSCRSQMAHGFLQSFDEHIQVFSAGTNPAEKINPTVVEVMKEANIDISNHIPTSVTDYINDKWDETCPAFTGEVGKRLHIGFDDPSDAAGTPDFIRSEFIRVRNDIKDRFYQFYVSEIKKE